MMILEKAVKRYGEKTALDGMDLDIADAGITCLLGASGCGKSTALRIAARLLEPDSGVARLPGGACGVVFQDARLLPWLTTRENLALALPKRDDAKISRALLDVGLDPDETGRLFPRELSGGMAQRAGIARALLRGSSCLMLDEPFAALDAMSRADLQDMLAALCGRLAIPALFVTHDMAEALKIGSRIMVMGGGRIALCLEEADFRGREAEASRIILQTLGSI